MADDGWLKKFLFGYISRKLMLGFLIVSLLVLVVGYVGVRGTNLTEVAFEDVTEDSVPAIDSLVHLQHGLENMRAESYDYVISGEEKHLTELDQAFKHFNEHKEVLISTEVGGDPEWTILFAKLEEVETKYRELSDQIINLKKQGALNGVTLGGLPQREEMESLSHEAAVLLKERENHEREELEKQKESVVATTTRMRWNVIVFSILVISLGSGLGFYISRSISGSINELHKATEELEKGNFKERVHIKTGDELEQLGNAFNKATEALGKIDEEHKQLDKAKTQFLSVTSHELRSPMTPMRAQLQMLVGGYFGKISKKQKESLGIVLNNTERLDGIIVDLLDVSRIEAARLKFSFAKTNLTEHINHLVEEMRGFMPEKNIALTTRIGKLPTIEVDPDRVMQVLRNLTSNAIKFTPNGGKVEISADREGDYIIFSVKDNGIGISPKNQKRVFEPFFQEERTLARKHGGTGLGLTICKGIIELQGGRVWLESELGKGTVFYFTVPLVPVKKIKPIKLMFSEQALINKKIEEVFKEALGPMGVVEFENLEKRGGLTGDDLTKYVHSLVKQKILRREKGESFEISIAEILGERPRKEIIGDSIERLFIEVLGPLGKKQVRAMEADLNKKAVFRRVDYLKKKHILNEKESEMFKRRAGLIFKERLTEGKVSEFSYGGRKMKVGEIERKISGFFKEGGGEG